VLVLVLVLVLGLVLVPVLGLVLVLVAPFPAVALPTQNATAAPATSAITKNPVRIPQYCPAAHSRPYSKRMAKPSRAHPANVAGPWFVDDTCIDCDACRDTAPTVFTSYDRDSQSIVAHQPVTPDDVLAAHRAMLLCPTASIGVRAPRPDLAALPEPFPQPLAPGVYRCGYNSPDSFGATTYFVTRPGGNLLIDGPRWVPSLARRIADLGGLHHIFLTHRDDIGDAARYADHFGARVWIHDADRSAARFATDLWRGETAIDFAPDLRVIPVPGHTRGSVVFLLGDDTLFTGDSLHWSRGLGALSAFEGACWYSWSAQATSLRALAELAPRFSWVLPGHGGHTHGDPAALHQSLLALVAGMESGVDHSEAPW